MVKFKTQRIETYAQQIIIYCIIIFLLFFFSRILYYAAKINLLAFVLYAKHIC